MLTKYNLYILVFLVLSALLVYAFIISIRGISRAKVIGRKPRRALWILGFIALIPFAVLDAFMWFLFLLSYYPHRSFDKDLWTTDVHQRYTMADDLVDSKSLIGLTKIQVTGLLGKPYNPWPQFKNTENNILYYDMSDRPTSGADPYILVIKFQNGVVIDCRLEET